MRIGIDIDGVLTNDDEYILDHTTKFCYENNLPFYENPNEYEIRKYKWNNEWLEQYRKEYFWKYAIEEPPRKFAKEVLKILKSKGNIIYIVTSRHLSCRESEEGEKMRSTIINWLQKYEISYDKIYFSPDKAKIIDNLKIEIMIEDSPITIPELAKHTHIFCYDCRYNKNLEVENMTRVYSWYDILNQIEKRTN